MANCVVELQDGSTRGVVEKHEEGFNYYAFKGVPYAEPPVGELRFKDPVPKKKWTGVMECKNYGPMCLQYDFLAHLTSTDEDCLYLNVFTRVINEPSARKPVIVSVHGGAYMFSSGSDFYYGPDYLIRKDIVLITFNYRVGILGFLDLEDNIAPGNQGLKDQVMVLQWIQQNIRAFGGDPNNVTVCGTFTGASAAHFLAISPLSKGLLHKVISQGCCLYNTWIISDHPKSNAIKLCSMLGKDLVDAKEILAFLMTVDAKVLQETQERLRRITDVIPFGPVTDNYAANPFMPVNREVAADEGIHLPYLIGYSSREGITLLLGTINFGSILYLPESLDGLGFPQIPREETLKMFDQDFKTIFRYNTRQVMDRHNLNEQQVRRLYYKSEKVSDDNIDNYVDFCSDFYFIEGIHKLARTQCERSSAPTYMYIFDYDSPTSLSRAAIMCFSSGAGLGDDAAHLFKMRFLETTGFEYLKKGTKGYRIMEQMTEMWANFARYGKPTVETSELIPVHWKPLSDGTLLRYLSIDEDLTMKYCLNVDQKLSSAREIQAATDSICSILHLFCGLLNHSYTCFYLLGL